jgi:hypothetical protein
VVPRNPSPPANLSREVVAEVAEPSAEMRKVGTMTSGPPLVSHGARDWVGGRREGTWLVTRGPRASARVRKRTR